MIEFIWMILHTVLYVSAVILKMSLNMIKIVSVASAIKIKSAHHLSSPQNHVMIVVHTVYITNQKHDNNYLCSKR